MRNLQLVCAYGWRGFLHGATRPSMPCNYMTWSTGGWVEVRGQGEGGVRLVRGRLGLVGRCIGLVGVEGREMGARPPTLKVGVARSRQGIPVMQDRYP